jgi:hypothetical protein
MEELNLVKEILRIFGATLGLVTNVRKCTSIQCEEQDLTVVQDIMPCNVVEFPIFVFDAINKEAIQE